MEEGMSALRMKTLNLKERDFYEHLGVGGRSV